MKLIIDSHKEIITKIKSLTLPENYQIVLLTPDDVNSFNKILPAHIYHDFIQSIMQGEIRSRDELKKRSTYAVGLINNDSSEILTHIALLSISENTQEKNSRIFIVNVEDQMAIDFDSNTVIDAETGLFFQELIARLFFLGFDEKSINQQNNILSIKNNIRLCAYIPNDFIFFHPGFNQLTVSNSYKENFQHRHLEVLLNGKPNISGDYIASLQKQSTNEVVAKCFYKMDVINQSCKIENFNVEKEFKNRHFTELFFLLILYHFKSLNIKIVSVANNKEYLSTYVNFNFSPVNILYQELEKFPFYFYLKNYLECIYNFILYDKKINLSQWQTSTLDEKISLIENSEQNSLLLLLEDEKANKILEDKIFNIGKNTKPKQNLLTLFAFPELNPPQQNTTKPLMMTY